MKKKQITEKEATQLLEEIGSHASVSVEIKDINGIPKTGYVLNNGMVYDPFTNKQRGMASNNVNAEKAMRQILKTGNMFSVYSSYFNQATGDYEILD